MGNPLCHPVSCAAACALCLAPLGVSALGGPTEVTAELVATAPVAGVPLIVALEVINGEEEGASLRYRFPVDVSLEAKTDDGRYRDVRWLPRLPAAFPRETVVAPGATRRHHAVLGGAFEGRSVHPLFPEPGSYTIRFVLQADRGGDLGTEHIRSAELAIAVPEEGRTSDAVPPVASAFYTLAPLCMGPPNEALTLELLSPTQEAALRRDSANQAVSYISTVLLRRKAFFSLLAECRAERIWGPGLRDHAAYAELVALCSTPEAELLPHIARERAYLLAHLCLLTGDIGEASTKLQRIVEVDATDYAGAQATRALQALERKGTRTTR